MYTYYYYQITIFVNNNIVMMRLKCSNLIFQKKTSFSLCRFQDFFLSIFPTLTAVVVKIRVISMILKCWINVGSLIESAGYLAIYRLPLRVKLSHVYMIHTVYIHYTYVYIMFVHLWKWAYASINQWIGLLLFIIIIIISFLCLFSFFLSICLWKFLYCSNRCDHAAVEFFFQMITVGARGWLTGHILKTSTQKWKWPK